MLDPREHAVDASLRAHRACHDGLPVLLQAPSADVVREALHEGDLGVQAEAAHRRDVLLDELLAEGLGGRGDHHAASALGGGHEVREGLAGARSSLDEERGAGIEGGLDGVGHAELLGARLVASEHLREGPPAVEQFARCHGTAGP